MNHPTWDMAISRREFKNVLSHPRDSRFPKFLIRVLSRVPFYDVFHGFLTPQQFQKYYPGVRKLLKGDIFGADRISFLDLVHRKLTSSFSTK